jgi:hypothetical protein
MAALPRYIDFPEILRRLSLIFPESFPDRAILVGEMAAKLFFVAIYGGFIASVNRFFRPSTIIRFSFEQAKLKEDAERLNWLSLCQAAGYRPSGQWYADNTREPLRDDLIRNKAIPMGIIVKREGVPPTSPAPIYCLADHFAVLFDPELTGDHLAEAITAWQVKYLDHLTLRRMRIVAQGVEVRTGEVEVRLPDGMVLRLAPGGASDITRDVCQELLKKIMVKPVVTHLSMSDQKIAPELAKRAEAAELHFSASAELPDIVAVDAGSDGLKVVFIEVVHSDGPITELRKKSLMKIANDAGIPSADVRFISAFEDRTSPAFRKRISELALDSSVWFRSEPHLLMKIENIG